MGQKTNPIGLRVGVSRKWAFSWVSQGTYKTTSTVQKSSDSAQAGHILLSQGVVAARGGFLLSSIEDRVRTFLRNFPSIKKNQSRQFLPISLQYRKGGQNHLFFFLSYAKLLGRRKSVKKAKKLFSNAH